MKRWLIWTSISVGSLLIIGFVGLSFMAGSPKDAVGNLKPGDSAPDVRLVALDGKTRFRLHERTQQRPLVLIFGSFT